MEGVLPLPHATTSATEGRYDEVDGHYATKQDFFFKHTRILKCNFYFYHLIFLNFQLIELKGMFLL